jgi:signal transduction histidine kinase
MAMRAGTTQGTFETVMREYVEDFGDRFGLLARVQSETPVPWLPPRTQAELLRVIQEALNNVRKHADATVVTVGSELVDGCLRLTVADNGRGFDSTAQDGLGYGFRGMRERCEIIGARLTIDSRASDGTSIIVDVPLTGNQEP